MKKTLVAYAVGVSLIVANTVDAALVTGVFGNVIRSTDHANFTMLDAIGGVISGTNDVAMTWDGDAYNASSDYTGPGGVSNVMVASATTFLGTGWASHDIQMFLPGTYSFDTALGGGNPETGVLNATVGVGQLGMHMLFDWSGNFNIDMFMVFSQNSVFGSGVVRSAAGTTYSGLNSCQAGIIKNCLWDGSNTVSGFEPTANQIWMLASVDGDGDGVMGVPMTTGGPFAGFNANFNADLSFPTPASVPIPAVAWLFGSGLAGLLGAARVRKIYS